MVEVGGVPIVEHHLRWLRDNGIGRAVLLTGYLHSVIEQYFAVDRVEGLQVECIEEDHPLGRGGAFRNGFEQAGITDDLVVATNGDVITDQPIAALLELHRQASASVTLMLVPLVSAYGIVETAPNGAVTEFVEKPVLPYWLNAGVYLIDGPVFSQFPSEGDHETSTFPALAAAGKLAAFKSDAFWRSVESPIDLQEVGEWLARGKAS